MADTEEPQVQAENVDVAEDSNVDTSPVDETTTSVSQETDGESEEQQVDATDTEDNKGEAERKPTRAERRIRQLSEEVKQLKSQPNQLDPSVAAPPSVEVEPGTELSVEDYQKHVAQAAQGVVAPQLDQLRAEFETKEASRNFDADAELIEKQYDELKDDSPLREKLEDEITKEFQQRAFRLVGFDKNTGEPQYRVDPSVRLADIAKEKVEFARAIAEQSSANLKNAVAKQADEVSPRPGAGVTSDKSVSDMSIEEMEAKFGIVTQ